jgi:hypothetical protein
MPSGRPAGHWDAFGVGRRARTRTGVYVSLKLVYIVWFLVRKVDPYYRKYKGIINSSNQLKR